MGFTVPKGVCKVKPITICVRLADENAFNRREGMNVTQSKDEMSQFTAASWTGRQTYKTRY